MNILYITHCDPRSTDFGSAQRSHLLWKALQEKGTVYTVAQRLPNVLALSRLNFEARG